MLRLAVENERTCDPVGRVVGKEVLRLFPNHRIDEYKQSIKELGTAALPVIKHITYAPYISPLQNGHRVST